MQKKSSSRKQQISTKTSDILTVPTVSNITPASLPIPAYEQEDLLPSIVNSTHMNGDPINKESVPQISARIQQLPYMNQMVN